MEPNILPIRQDWQLESNQAWSPLQYCPPKKMEQTESNQQEEYFPVSVSWAVQDETVRA